MYTTWFAWAWAQLLGCTAVKIEPHESDNNEKNSS